MRHFMLLAAALWSAALSLLVPLRPDPALAQAAPAPAVAQAEPKAPCVVGDVNCDQALNILDLQLIAARMGAPATDEEAARLDLDSDGTIGMGDLDLARSAWRLRPAQLAGGPPRLGYAVGDQGQVFLRWHLPISPYAAPVELLRSPAPVGAPPAGHLDAGVVATLEPIRDDATALPLLGAYWDTLRVAFETTTDADGNQIAAPLPDVAAMHRLAEAGANGFVVQQLINRDPGVARVFGRGYLDSDTQPSGVYTYWLRAAGRLLGPLRVDTSKRTILPAPTGLLAFEGSANVDAPADTWARQSQLRVAHASVFLTWDTRLDRRESHPEWPDGYNVWRKECEPGTNNCGEYIKLNDLPVHPRALAEEATASEVISNTAGITLTYGTELHDFEAFWADRELNPAKLYCYRVTARDLLGQDGRPSAETRSACLQPPDYLPPDIPDVLGAQPRYNQAADNFTMFVRVRNQPDTPRNDDFSRWQVYAADKATAIWPDEWWLLDEFSSDIDRPFYDLPAQRDMSEHNQRWYRVVAVDMAGNVSAPSTPVLGSVDDTEAPRPPLPCVAIPGQPTPSNCVQLDSDTAAINIYRKLSRDGLALLVEQVPVDSFDWATWQDSFTPAQESDLYYELRAVDEAGNLSGPSLTFVRQASAGVALEPATPVIDEITWERQGNRYNAKINWIQMGAGSVDEFVIYRSQGADPPASIAEMTPIQNGIIAILIGLAYETRYSFTDTNRDPNTLYWYAIEAKGRFGAQSEVSDIRAARYIAVGPEPTHPIAGLPLSADVLPNGVQLNVDSDECCLVIMRSRRPNGGFSQITPIIHASNYYDIDVVPGEIYFYQALMIDIGAPDLETATGEILAASEVRHAIVPGGPTPPPPAPLAPPPQTVLPRTLPFQLHFGKWPVQVRAYDLGSSLANASGDGALSIEVAPGDLRDVWVQFNGLQLDADGNVRAINPGGSATVEIGPSLTPAFPDRMLTTYTNMRLQPDGAVADLHVTSLGAGLAAWDVWVIGPGQPINNVPVLNQPISTPSLKWNRVATGHIGQSCEDRTSIVAAFAVPDWPLYIVPTDAYTVTESGINFGTTCTLYRDRFSLMSSPGEQISEGLNYRNDLFLRPSYTGTSASYSVSDGLSGSWSHSGEASYTTAWPFGFEISADSRSFTFENGQLSSGSIGAGELTFTYAAGLNPSNSAEFSGSFDELAIGPGGALAGIVSSDSPVHWTAFTISAPDYGLYVPAALTWREPQLTWPAHAGDPASGVPGDRSASAGLNAYDRDLSWSVCPNLIARSATFPENEASKLDLFLRRSGVTGRVDFVLDPALRTSVSGYQTDLSRFAYSWLSNLEAASGIAGSFVLPYPADIELEFDSLNLDSGGCITQGDVLPEQKTLAYWHLGIIPRAVDLRIAEASPGPQPIPRTQRLWLIGDYRIPNLRQAEGPADDLVQMEASFAPNGTFVDSEIFAEQTVYEVDGFYTVVRDLRLSDYSQREEPGWDASITTEAPPATIDGFIELTAGVYLPYFGEATDPDSAKIYLLGDRPYVGFDQRPAVERTLSEQLKIILGYDLAYAQATGSTPSRWIGTSTLPQRSLDVEVLGNTIPIVQFPYTLVAEPDAMRLLFGFPAPAGALLAAEEAFASWGGRGAADRARLQAFRPTLLMGDGVFDADIDFALELIERNKDDYKQLIDELDAVIGDDGVPRDWLAETGVSGLRVQVPLLPGILESSPLQLEWPRGDATILPVQDNQGRVIDGTLDLLKIAAYVKIYQDLYNDDEEQAALLRAAMEMELDPQGSIYLAAKGAESNLIDGEMSMDAEMRLLFSPSLGYGAEGGLTFYDYSVPAGTIDRVGAVAGFTLIPGPPAGVGLLYVGATLDADVALPALGRVNFGGSMLFGRVDPTSPVLQAEYGELFEDMGSPSSGIIQGGYFLAYANNIPIYSLGAGCVGVQISGGGEMAFWAFNRAGTSDNAWGVRLGVNAMGKAFCVAVAKADVKLQLDNDFGEDNLDLTGTAWAGAGCGFCEPEDWRRPADVLDDNWCVSCVIDLYFSIPLKGSQSRSEFDFDADCAF